MVRIKTQKIKELDSIDLQILNILQLNSRKTLKEIASELKISIDTAHNRIKELEKEKILFFQASIDPRLAGFPIIADIKIRIKNANEEQKQELINYLVKFNRCSDLLEIMGDYDFTCVLFARNSDEFSEISSTIRHKFKDIIDEWKSILVLRTHKFDYFEV